MAGSANAFASMSTAQARPASVLSEQDHNIRATKRVRLAEDAVAAIDTHRADPETSLEVDHMSLDYIADQTLQACFASRDDRHALGSLASSIALFDAFLWLFKTRHPAYRPDPELRFRISLLRLTTVFTQRLTANPTTPSPSDLLELRDANRDRAAMWARVAERAPSLTLTFAAEKGISQQQLERNRAHMLHELGIPAEDEDHEEAFYGTPFCVSLLDMLPMFMQISAARNAMSGSNLTQRWMNLACHFMFQACLEQYMVFGAPDFTRTVDEAFAWGYQDGLMDVDADAKDKQDAGWRNSNDINAMFEDEEYATEVEGWTEVKMAYMAKLALPEPGLPRQARDLGTHLEAVAAQHSMAAFEKSLLRFLEAISKSIASPVLCQLERGQLDGMTKDETKAFLAGCGLSVASFFEAPAGFKSPDTEAPLAGNALDHGNAERSNGRIE